MLSATGTDCSLVLPPNIGWFDLGSGEPTLTDTGCGTPLPVELTRFVATADGRDVVLQWQTASETNNAGFEIQSKGAGRSSDNVDLDTWHVWDFVEGHGTTLEPQTYQHRLEDFAPGPYRFRLKQLDFDGAFEYSPEVEVALELVEAFYLSAVYPNPFNPQTQLSLMVKRAQHVTVSVYDVLGRQVAVLFAGEMAPEQARSLVFEANALPSGTYVIQAVGETFTASQRAVLAK